MIGITSIGAYIPMYRLSREDIGKMWQTKGSGGEKAVAGYDEDANTMAMASTLNCMKRRGQTADGFYFATTTGPYKEKQNSALIAAAVDMAEACRTADFGSSLRAGTIAMKAAIDAVKAGSCEHVVVTASDCRVGTPKGKLEQLLGDGAASVMIGNSDVIADIEESYSIYNDFTDLWRTDCDDHILSGEDRFMDEVGYMPTMQQAISELLKRCTLTPADFSKAVFYAADEKQHAALARRLGFDKAQVQDPLYKVIGNTGTAAALMMLIAALEEAKPGDRILFASYGNGADAFVLHVTEGISGVRGKPTMQDRLARRQAVDYGRYLDWRELLSVESGNLPDRARPSLASRWRERKGIAALYGVKCRKCGTPQIHPIGQTVRICAMCQSKDDFEAYRFSDKTAKLFTFSVDKLQPTKNSPGVNGVVDFDGGGRLLMELTDYEVDKVKVGMPLEMTWRIFFKVGGVINYFWKAKPIQY
jgi:hydroxymethylglutaryl-CoA synthase